MTLDPKHLQTIVDQLEARADQIKTRLATRRHSIALKVALQAEAYQIRAALAALLTATKGA
jgi:hypothetical protein